MKREFHFLQEKWQPCRKTGERKAIGSYPQGVAAWLPEREKIVKTCSVYRFFKKSLPIVLLCSLLWSGLFREHSVARAEAAPINPNASAEARELYMYLSNLNGTGTITGQHDYLESPDELNIKLKNISGQYAGVHGYELGASSNQSAAQTEAQRNNVVYSAIQWHKAGGIVSMTFHETLPGRALTWANVQAKITQAQFDKYVTPGTTEYENLIADLDQVAVSLGKLRDAGVPVLWRPYHEMNGDWFWWGNKKNFSKLWDIMYDRLVNVHKLNNLLWVWNPNAPNAWAGSYSSTFPGLSKVDILAADIYNNDFQQSYYTDLLSLAGSKPIAIGEQGEVPPESVLSAQPKWVYSMTWGNMLTQNNSNSQIVAYMNDARTLTRDEMAASMVTAPPLNQFGDGAQPATDVIYSGGLRADFFNNVNLSGTPVLTRTDANLNFNWRNASPDPAVSVNNFSARWTGMIKPKYSGTYTFGTISDDGIRVWVNGQLVIDSWKKQSWIERNGSLTIEADRLYDFKVEFYEGTGDAMVRLMWESNQERKSVIPSSAFFHIQ